MTESIRRHWGAAGSLRPYFGRLVPLPATRSESVSALLSAIVHNLHNINLHFVMIDYSRKTEGEKKNVGQAEKESI